MNHKSHDLFTQAKHCIPGGVNSPVRAFQSVGMEPIYIDHAKGSKIYDVDGNCYIDYVGSWGPLILGHGDQGVLDVIFQAAPRGTSFGTCTEIEVRMAQFIQRKMPSIEKLRMVNSGTEATMSALRLARGYTGRNKFIKLEGCYHGHGDSFLMKAGSGLLTHGIPGSPGITPETASNTLIGQFNHIDTIEKLIEVNRGEIAALILEPIMANAGLVLPKGKFLHEIRALTESEGILLIFDEVITGFRVSPGGAQELYGITPDLTTLGKIIGGGLPVGAFGGRRDIMDQLSPLGPVYQAGTLSGNPLALAAGFETLTRLDNQQSYVELEEKAALLENGLKEQLTHFHVPFSLQRCGSLLGLAFTSHEIVDFSTAMTTDTLFYGRYFKEMLKRGIYLAPSAFEVAFISLSHSLEDIHKTLDASRQSLKAMGC